MKSDLVGLDLSSSERESFAQKIAEQFGQNSTAVQELNDAISIVASYGLDENLRMYDVLNTSNSVFLSSSEAIDNLAAAVKESNVLADYGFTANNYYADLQFYWPYHDDWDGVTTPIVCFAPEVESVDHVNGFYYEDGVVKTKVVYAADVDSGITSVIIINEGEIPYSKYPTFVADEWTKDGVKWIKPLPLGSLNPVKDSSTSSTKVYEARTTSFTSSNTHYDNLWHGGNEFDFMSFYTTNGSQITKSVTAHIEFTRGEIRKGTTKSFGAQLHEDWQSAYGEIGVLLTEINEGISFSPININIDVNGNTLSTTININSTNTVISNDSWSRNAYFNGCINQGGEFALGPEKVTCMLDIYDSFDNY